MTVPNEVPADSEYPIGSVDNALRLLESFAREQSIRVSEASRTLGVARSTAHRLLQALAGRGFVTQDPNTRAYLVGPALLRLAVAVSRKHDLSSIAQPIMTELVEALGETVHLAVLHETNAFFLESIETSRGLRVGGRAGQLIPAHATATGRVLLADLSSAELRRLLPSMILPQLTPLTVNDRGDLESVLTDVRQQGYATSFGESEEEVSSVAVPIRGHEGGVVAALAVGAPPSRLSEGDLPRIVEALRSAADRISSLMR